MQMNTTTFVSDEFVSKKGRKGPNNCLDSHRNGYVIEDLSLGNDRGCLEVASFGNVTRTEVNSAYSARLYRVQRMSDTIIRKHQRNG